MFVTMKDGLFSLKVMGIIPSLSLVYFKVGILKKLLIIIY